jgi:hypothetical protein
MLLVKIVGQVSIGKPSAVLADSPVQPPVRRVRYLCIPDFHYAYFSFGSLSQRHGSRGR